MDDVPVLDEGALARLDDWGGPKLRDQMIRLYLESARTRVEQLERGLRPGGDVASAELAAHSLRSSAANVGLMRVSALAARIEAAAETGDTETARAAHAELLDAVREGEAALPDPTPPEEV